MEIGSYECMDNVQQMMVIELAIELSLQNVETIVHFPMYRVQRTPAWYVELHTAPSIKGEARFEFMQEFMAYTFIGPRCVGTYDPRTEQGPCLDIFTECPVRLANRKTWFSDRPCLDCLYTNVCSERGVSGECNFGKHVWYDQKVAAKLKQEARAELAFLAGDPYDSE